MSNSFALTSLEVFQYLYLIVVDASVYGVITGIALGRSSNCSCVSFNNIHAGSLFSYLLVWTFCINIQVNKHIQLTEATLLCTSQDPDQHSYQRTQFSFRGQLQPQECQGWNKCAAYTVKAEKSRLVCNELSLNHSLRRP